MTILSTAEAKLTLSRARVYLNESTSALRKTSPARKEYLRQVGRERGRVRV
jgi:hypothetical protein